MTTTDHGPVLSEQGGELEYRSSQLAEVNFPKRLIELVVMPYERETVVAHRGRPIVELCSRGAFDGVEERSSRIRVNRGHDRERTVGKTVALHPSRDEGLVAEVRIARTELGDETLQLADEELLDASASFALLRDKTTGRVKDRAEVWENRDRRRLNHLWLDHIALVPDPAYADARVLAVRSREPGPVDVAATPNRDRLEIEQLRSLYDDIDRRYGLSR